MIKQNFRVLGIDDGPFDREKQKFTSLVGVLMRIDGTVEKVSIQKITVDGNDVQVALLGILEKIGISPGIIMSEGVTFGGFNLLEPGKVFTETGCPFISVVRKQPDVESMLSAVGKYNPGDVDKTRIIRSLSPVYASIGQTRFTLNFAGVGIDDAMRAVRMVLKTGFVPEPVRIAHLIASATAEFENQS